MALSLIILLQWLGKQQELIFYACSLSFFLLFFSLLFLLRQNKSCSSTQYPLPPSPPRLPVIGNLHQLGTLAHRSLQKLSAKDGPLMLLHIGRVPILVVSSADMARQVMKTHDVTFASRPLTTAAKMFAYGGKDVVFAPYGEYWRQMRKLCVVELLSIKRVQSFKVVREEEISKMIEKVSQSCLIEAQVNVSEMLLTLFKDIICRCAFGGNYGGGDHADKKFEELTRQISELFQAFSFADFFPYLGWVDVLTGLVRRMKSISQALDILLDQVIEEHIVQRKREEYHLDTRDFVDLLLQVQEIKNLDIDLTRDNIRAILLDMFAAGFETTATTVEWAMAELVKNPNVMKKAQEEVRRLTIRKTTKIEDEDIHQMSYLKCCIKETLRLHPPFTTSIPRELLASTILENYHIPSKTTVLINIWAIQRDPKLWTNADKFMPERFLDSSVDFKGQDFEFIPFGSGRRSCPGISFALAGVELVLANLLCWFAWKLPGHVGNKGELDMTEAPGISVYKKIPLHLIPTPAFSTSNNL